MQVKNLFCSFKSVGYTQLICNWIPQSYDKRSVLLFDVDYTLQHFGDVSPRSFIAKPFLF